MAFDEQTLASGKIKIKWEEQYTSDAIAKYNYSSQNFGIAKGFDIQPDGDQTIRLAHDPGDDESVVVVNHEAKRRGFVLVEPTENVFDIQNWSGDTVYVFVYVNYQLNQDTSVSIRISDTKTGESWMESAKLLGSVDVPSGDPIANPIEESDIDLYDTEFVGVNSTISGTKWNLINSNTKFQRRLTGYGITGDEDYVSYDGVNEAAELGTTVDSQGGNTASLSFGDGDLEQGDDIWIRVQGSTNELEDDAKLLLETPGQTFEITSGLDGANQSNFQRGIRFQAGDLSSSRIKLTLDLSNTSTTTGEVSVNKFEVYTHDFPRKVGTIESKERYDLLDKTQNVDGNDRASIEHVDYSLAFTDMAASAVKLSEWALYEDLPDKTNIDSILEGIEHGSRGAGVVDEVWPGRVVDGLYVEKVGAEEVQIDSGTIAADASRKQARLEDVPSYSSVNVTADGDNHYIVADPEEIPGNSSFIKQVPDNIYDVEINGYVPLAWVETSTTEITAIYNAQDFLTAESHTDELKVGQIVGSVNFTPDHARFNSLKYVCELLRQDDDSGNKAWRGKRRIEIVDDITIATPNIPLPENCVISSDKNSQILVTNIDGDNVFDVEGENIRVEDIDIFGSDSTLIGIGTVEIFSMTGPIDNFTLKNVRVQSDGNNGRAFNRCLVDTTGTSLDGNIKVEGCELKSTQQEISISETDPSPNAHITVKDCQIGSFDNFSSVNTKGQHVTLRLPEDASSQIQNSRVGFTDGENQSVFLRNVDLLDCDLYCEINLGNYCTAQNIHMPMGQLGADGDKGRPIELSGDYVSVDGLLIENGLSDDFAIACQVSGDHCRVFDLKVDYADGEAIQVSGAHNRVEGYSIRMERTNDTVNTAVKVNSVSHITLVNGDITFLNTPGVGLEVLGGGENIRVDGLSIRQTGSIGTNEASPSAIIHEAFNSHFSGIKYFSGFSLADTAIENNGNGNLFENCILHPVDTAIECSGNRNIYSSIHIFKESPSATSLPSMIYCPDGFNKQFNDISMYGTWDTGAPDSQKLRVLPFDFENGTGGISVKDCMVEADPNAVDGGGGNYDPQDTPANFIDDDGTSSDGSGNDTVLLSNGKDSSGGAFALFELLAHR